MIPRYLTIVGINNHNIRDINLQSDDKPDAKLQSTIGQVHRYMYEDVLPVSSSNGENYIELRDSDGFILRREFKNHQWEPIQYISNFGEELINIIEVLSYAIKQDKRLIVQIIQKDTVDSKSAGVFLRGGLVE